MYLVQCISVSLRCFYERTKGAEGAKHLIKALAQSAVLEECSLRMLFQTAIAFTDAGP